MLYSFSRRIEWAYPHTNRIINKKVMPQSHNGVCPSYSLYVCVCVHLLTYAIMLSCFYRQPRLAKSNRHEMLLCSFLTRIEWACPHTHLIINKHIIPKKTFWRMSLIFIVCVCVRVNVKLTYVDIRHCDLSDLFSDYYKYIRNTMA